ncbi:inositol 2-dehydrogenase [Reichenbachiella sp. MALMAid0571]|uniref:inositol 2-dehydrogenase n=1 Tax=Reichenbachiella sp. MALMAid0571 TaxID=3143939 RepID=UPI0032E0552E
MDKVKIGILGLGRIGKIHLGNLAGKIEGAEVVAVVNPSEEGQDFARKFNVPFVSSDANVIFDNEDLDAVLICSPNDTHADYVTRAAQSKKAVFCEKPLDLSLSKVKEIIEVTQKHNVPLMVAFNQRFDINFSKIKSLVKNGKVGDLRTIKITSRDPAPPPIGYIKSSGGLFLDMTIHDFDMARHIADSEVIEVFAKGSNLVDPAIGEAGDIDTGYVVLSFENGATALIENSRQAAYGYDQRLEVFGSKGMAQANNNFKDTHLLFDEKGVHGSRPLDFFMDRYIDSYLHEMNAFIQALTQGTEPPVNGIDGLKATAIAIAANKSMEENRPVKMTEILDV